MSSFGLLLKNELRLWWRRLTGAKHFWAIALFIAIALTVIFALLWLLFTTLRSAMAITDLSGALPWTMVSLWLIALLFAFNQALGESVVVLFERGDLDLLLSSPVSGRAVFAVRLMSLALKVFTGFMLLVVPTSAAAVLIGFPQLLGLYPALISICLIAASLGMLVALWVVRLVGARRARSLVQVLNLGVSLVIIVGAQIPNYLISSGADMSGIGGGIGGGIGQWISGWVAPGGWLAANSWVWFPARAILFDPVSVAVSLAMSGAIATFTVFALDKAFSQGMRQSVTRKKTARIRKNKTWRSGLTRIMLAKEWRSMRRHPYLISQVAFQVVLLLPLTWILIAGDGNPLLDVGQVANVGLPFLGSQLSSTLTYIVMSGEEAPDLLKAAPVPSAKLRRLKQLAALIPVWLLLLPAVVALMAQGYAGLSAMIAMLGASVSSSLLRLWNSRPAPSGTLFRRRPADETELVLTGAEVVSPWLWVMLGWGLYSGVGALVLLSVVLLGVLFAIARWRASQIGSFLQY